MTADAPAVGVVAADPTPVDAVIEAVEGAGARALSLDPDEVEDQDVVGVVAVEHGALSALAEQGLDVPILSLRGAPGLPGIPQRVLSETVEALLAGDVATVDAPILSVAVDGRTVARGYREVTVVTSEPASISEFGIAHAREGQLDTVRADGVVVATPAGSHGYAGAGDGPILAPETGLAVVPIAPFRIHRDRWVVPADQIGLSIEREGASVTVEVDGMPVEAIDGAGTVGVSPGESLTVVRPPEGTSAGGTGLERH